MQKQPRISVILPFYNAERTLSACLESIRSQSLRELEILAVDDGSTDSSAAIVGTCASQDARVRLLSHPENLGLFEARLTGVRAARGRYIAFVDADDAVSSDWFRLLLRTAEQEACDLTVGQLLCHYGEDRIEYFPLDPLRRPLSLDGEQVLSAFLGQEGSCYSWHVVWNKLYARHLFLDALPDLERFSSTHPHMIMCEDIAFSAAIWTRAVRVRSVTSGAYYFYNRASEGQSTSARQSRTRILHNLRQAAAAFSFLGDQLRRAGAPADCFAHAAAWRAYYGEMYFHLLAEAHGHRPGRDAEQVRQMLSLSEDTEIGVLRRTHGFFYTSARAEEAVFRLESLKRAILDESVDAVSFDLFDTLLLRPFLFPSDLFLLLDDSFNRLFGTEALVRFSALRVRAEAACRERIAKEGVGGEEVTLEEIYDELSRAYGLDRERLACLAEEEEALELRFSTARQAGRELLFLARDVGKRILLLSDIYLPEELIRRILEKHGYPFDALYLSSSTRLTKASGSLFSYAAKQEGIPPERILHVGDNWESDVLSPQRVGWRSAHFPKPSDLLRNWNPGSYTGEAYASLVARGGQERDGQNAEEQFLGYRCAMALTANRLFDDPFTLFGKPSDFGGDPYRIGYFALGHYLLALVDWIAQSVRGQTGERVHFVARDGYLPMQAYRILREEDPTLPREHYLFLSRKALALSDLASPTDLLSLWDKWSPSSFSPCRLDELFAPYRKEGSPTLRERLGLPEGLYEKPFRTREQAERALAALTPSIDFAKLSAHREELRSYFGGLIHPSEHLFDIGYSGRAEAALTSLLGFPVNSLYLHAGGQILSDRSARYGFSNACFFDYKPAITGVIREHVLMKLSPSVVGYERIGGVLQPKWETYSPDPRTVLVTEILQAGALDFVRDMCRTFGRERARLPYRRADLAAAFEAFLHHPKELDRAVFGSLLFEDDLGAGRSFSALDFWDRERAVFGLSSASAHRPPPSLPEALSPYPRWKKALSYLLLDPAHLLRRVRARIKRENG